MASGAPHRELHRLAGAVLEGVGEQVRDHLIELAPVKVSPCRTGANPNRAAGALRLCRHPRDDVGDQIAQLQLVAIGLEAAGLQARHVEQLAGELRQSLGGAGDRVEQRAHPRQRALAQTQRPLHLEAERGERRAQLVRGDREEGFPDRERLGQVALDLLQLRVLLAQAGRRPLLGRRPR